MAKVYINAFGRFNERPDRPSAGGAQVLDGQCSQDRAYIASTGAFNNAAPVITVAPETEYVQIVTDETVLVWAGKSTVTGAVKQARALAVGAGTYTFEVSAGQVVHVWTAP